MGVRVLASLVLAAVVGLGSTPAAAVEAQTILHLLDYVGVDYPEAVADGKVKNEDEYKEMLKFTAQAAAQLKALPPNPRKDALVAAAESLAALVAAKAGAAAVADAAGKLRWALIEAYGVRVAPQRTPDLAAGAKLYAQHCAACHGAQGRGDGPAAKGLEPAPSDFHDAARMAQRSVYGLYNTITLGVAGTSMVAFERLDDPERWALAFYIATLGASQERLREGGSLWQAGEARGAFPDLTNVATLSANEVVERFGERASAVQAWLRANPEALAAVKPAPLAFTRAKLAAARTHYAQGDRPAARDAAIRGYLEGFGLVEVSLANADARLAREIERRMLELRAAIERGDPSAAVADQVRAIDALLAAAERTLGAGDLSPATAFASAFLILLREGLEAILVLAAILAFAARTGRRDALPYVHAGWITALALGAVTWAAATWFIEISGANRELTEGITALVAAAMLLYVGWWLHGKSYAQAWARFVRDQVGQALAKRTLWAMAAVSFFAVYREMFEIVLFYQALWVQAGESGRSAVLGGMAAAALALAVIGFVIFRYSVRLPIGPFFAATSFLLALLAVMFTGHGVAALQEAGVIQVTSLGFEPVTLLGIYPTAEALGAQAAVLAAVVLGCLATRRSAAAASSSAS